MSRSVPVVLLLIMTFVLAACQEGPDSKIEPIKITLATTPVIYTGLIAIAEHEGFFRQSGLDVTIRSDYPAGLQSMQALERGEVQMATGAAFVFAGMMEAEPSLRILASVGSTSDHEIVARKDTGILQPADLRGKRIGVVLDTVSEYALSLFLQMNGIDPTTVTVVDVSPPKMPEALARGEVDAVSVWGKFSYLAAKELGGKGITWPSQYSLEYYWVLAAREDLLRSSPEIAERLLLALMKAEQFALSNEEQAKAIITSRWDLEPDFVAQAWDKNKLRVALDQPLINALESAVRWRTDNKASSGDMPNVLSKMYPAPLEAVDPKAVTLYR